jgi:fluoroquinolone resistance protein
MVLHKCNVKNVDFREADLSLADMQYSDFVESLFINSNLSDADFSHAINYSINVTLNKIKNAKFMLPEAAGLLYGLEIILKDL